MKYRLSPSSLNLLEDCPRCFWLQMVKNIKRPSGPISSFPIKMDSILKHYFDMYRELNQLPPILDGNINGRLAVDMPKTLKYEFDNGIILTGRPDDYLEIDDRIIALDHKTRSKAPECIHPYYQLQLDVYSFLLRNIGYDTINKGILAFYYPYPDDCELHEGMPINCTILKVKTNHKRVTKLVYKAYNVLLGKIPYSQENCIYCKWIEETTKIL